MSRGNPEMQPGGWRGSGAGWGLGLGVGGWAGAGGRVRAGGEGGAGAGAGSGGLGAGGLGGLGGFRRVRGLRGRGWGLGAATHANASRTLANACERFANALATIPGQRLDPWTPTFKTGTLLLRIRENPDVDFSPRTLVQGFTNPQPQILALPKKTPRSLQSGGTQSSRHCVGSPSSGFTAWLP